MSLRCQAEGLENLAFHTVTYLADMAFLVDKGTIMLKEFMEFEELLNEVSKMLLRGGSDSGSQEETSGKAEA